MHMLESVFYFILTYAGLKFKNMKLLHHIFGLNLVKVLYYTTNVKLKARGPNPASIC